MNQIKTFKSPSQIKFDVKSEELSVIGDTSRGQTFLYKGSVCMRADVSFYQAVKDLKNCAQIQDQVKTSIWITNLQTGRTFIVSDQNEPVSFVKVRMTLEGE